MSIDVERARRETPGCAHVVHFNNAGASLMPAPVVRAIVSHIEREAGIGGYEAAEEVDEELEGVYRSIATLLHAGSDEIAIVENATRAWDMAFYSIPLAPGDRILTSVSEYASNVIAFLQAARRTGAGVEVIPNDASGQISVPALRKMLDKKVKLIAITHVPTNGGLVNPAAEIGRVARENEILYLLDACQSAGQLPLDVEALGCDMLSATGRKYLRGPRGTGFLYVRRTLARKLEPPFLDMHAATWTAPHRYEVRSDARRFENWESNVAAKLGLGAAVDYALSWGLPAIEERVTALADLLRRELEKAPGVALHDLGEKKCGLVSFTVAGEKPEATKRRLSAAGINVWCSSDRYTLFDMEKRGLPSVVRASVHYYNDEDEVGRFTRAVASRD